MNLPPIVCDRKPHIFATWEEFLAQCQLVESFEEPTGTTYYFSALSHNYFVLPNGYLHDNMGHYGEDFMDRIRTKGWESAMESIKQAKEFLNKFGSLGRSSKFTFD